MARSVIALLTDFGLHDHYVGVMKGVILGIAPDVTIVDITHDIPPQDIAAAAYELEAAYAFFPAGTIFVTVVDPGVGSSRRAVALEAGGYVFVAPDNGVLSLVAARHTTTAVVELSKPEYARETVSRTFEGRDRFAPAAAWLARGTPMTTIGRAIQELGRYPVPVAERRGDEIVGEVVRVDRFGNLITNIDRASVEEFGPTVTVVIARQVISGLTGTYADAAAGSICAIVGSSGRLEVAVSGGSAQAAVGAGRRASVHVRSGA